MWEFHTCPHSKPFRVKALPCHVHYRACTYGIFIHPRASGGRVSATHPKLEGGGWVRSARPLEGSADGGFLLVFLSEGGIAVVCSGPTVGVTHELKVPNGRIWPPQLSRSQVPLQSKRWHLKLNGWKQNSLYVKCEWRKDGGCQPTRAAFNTFE